ncbi:30S ribosomal protein S17 [Frigoriglobus tundricola]|uniref:Small ribosomal subunit protein uS17 n=1 Tax=Frigoriglobus tundricola TaxID=2774151 RepID=A0A6M5YYF8_9BACT|nr:SSU ribosomal protein S17p (S11e) [Frigoriglobus tundricola]
MPDSRPAGRTDFIAPSKQTTGRRVLEGVVTRDKASKTRRVEVERLVRQPKYGKFVKRRTVCYVHDERNEAHLGDIVLIVESRPLSKLKRWNLVKILKKAPSRTLSNLEGAVVVSYSRPQVYRRAPVLVPARSPTPITEPAPRPPRSAPPNVGSSTKPEQAGRVAPPSEHPDPAPAPPAIAPPESAPLLAALRSFLPYLYTDPVRALVPAPLVKLWNTYLRPMVLADLRAVKWVEEVLGPHRDRSSADPLNRNRRGDAVVQEMIDQLPERAWVLASEAVRLVEIIDVKVEQIRRGAEFYSLSPSIKLDLNPEWIHGLIQRLGLDTERAAMLSTPSPREPQLPGHFVLSCRAIDASGGPEGLWVGRPAVIEVAIEPTTRHESNDVWVVPHGTTESVRLAVRSPDADLSPGSFTLRNPPPPGRRVDFLCTPRRPGQLDLRFIVIEDGVDVFSALHSFTVGPS